MLKNKLLNVPCQNKIGFPYLIFTELTSQQRVGGLETQLKTVEFSLMTGLEVALRQKKLGSGKIAYFVGLIDNDATITRKRAYPMRKSD